MEWIFFFFYTMNETLQNALFICPECGRLSIMLNDFWKESDDPSIIPQSRLINQYIKRPFHVFYSSSPNWKYQSLVQDNALKFESHEIPFPICNDCLSLWFRSLQKEIKLIKEATKAYGIFDISKKESYPRIIQEKINETNNSIRTLSGFDFTVSKSQPSLVDQLTDSESFHPNPHISNIYQIQNHIISPSIKSVSESTKQIFVENPSLVKYSTFHISFDQFFGTINSNRLGIGKDITPTECNIAFFFLTHLIISISKIMNVEISNILLEFPIAILSDGKKLVLNASDLSGRRGIASFNKAIELFMEICYPLFQKSQFSSNLLAPPFHLDLTKKTIGRDSYKFDRNNKDEWNRAMKNLLTNFKLLQIWAFSNSYCLIKEIESSDSP